MGRKGLFFRNELNSDLFKVVLGMCEQYERLSGGFAMKQSKISFKSARSEAPGDEQDDTKKRRQEPLVVELDGVQVTLSAQQAHVVAAAEGGKHLFLTGCGGTGKSLVLKVVIDRLKVIHGTSHVFVTASTGTAAVALNGTTLHSFAGVGLGEGTIDNLYKKANTRPDSRNRWKTAKVLIIDEISMLSPGYFEMLDQLACRMRKSQLIFGGIQLILAGDFLQLPFIPDQKSPSKTAEPFLFETPTWRRMFAALPSNEEKAHKAKKGPSGKVDVGGEMIHLTRVYRQRDKEFIELLQAVRFASLTPAHIALLQSRVGVKLDCSDGIKPTRLFPYKKDVHAENNVELGKVPGGCRVFTATDKGLPHFIETLNKHCQATQKVALKVGAQVVLLRNLDFARGLVNGSRGVLIDFVPSPTAGVADSPPVIPLVRFSHGIDVVIAEAEWKMESGNTVLCTRKQIPLALAWASSIHSSQGTSLTKVESSLAHVFEDGQAYTALSRCTSLEGLSLLDFNPAKITANPRVIQFYNEMV